MVQAAFHDLQPASGASYVVSLQLAPEAPTAGLTPAALTATHKRAAWNSHRGLLISHVVTARDDVLAVYEVRRRSSISDIRLICRHRVAGRITGVVRIRTRDTATDGKERLAVSFRAAKLSLLEFDDQANDLVSISVHTYERVTAAAAGGAFLSRPVDGIWVPYLRADTPSTGVSRCVALSLPGGLALLPFGADGEDLFGLGADAGTDLDLDLGLDLDADLDGVGLRAALLRERELPYTPSLLLPFDSQVVASPTSAAPGAPELGIGAMRDMAFLPGFSSPSLAILHEPLPSFSGMLRARSGKDSLALHVLTLDLSPTPNAPGSEEDSPFAQTRAGATVLTCRANLPLDSLYIVAPPPSIGGVVVVSTTAIWHVSQAGRIKGLSVNRWTSFMTALPAVRWPPLEDAPPYPSTENVPGSEPPPPPHGPDLDLSHSQLTFLTQAGEGASAEAILALRSGELYSLIFHLDGRSLREMSLWPLGQTVQPSSLAILPKAASSQPDESPPNGSQGDHQGQDMEMADVDDDALYGGNSITAPANDTALAGDAGLLFVGSQVEDMELLALSRAAVKQDGTEDPNPSIMDLGDEDQALYGYLDNTSGSRGQMGKTDVRGGALKFSSAGRISALGPIAALAPTAVEGKVVAATGARSAGSISYFEPNIRLREQRWTQLEDPSLAEDTTTRRRLFVLGTNSEGDLALVSGSEHSTLIVLSSGGARTHLPTGTVDLPHRTLFAAKTESGFIRVTPEHIELRTCAGKLIAWRSVNATSGDVVPGCVLAIRPAGAIGFHPATLAPIPIPSSIAPDQKPKKIHAFYDTFGLLRTCLATPPPGNEASSEGGMGVEAENNVRSVPATVLEGVTETKSAGASFDHTAPRVWITFTREDSFCATTLHGDVLLSIPLALLASCPDRWTWTSFGAQTDDELTMSPGARLVDLQLVSFNQTPHLVMLQADGLLTAYEAVPFVTPDQPQIDATDVEPDIPNGIAFVKAHSSYIGKPSRAVGTPTESDSDTEMAPPSGEPVHGLRIRARFAVAGAQLWITGPDMDTCILHRVPGSPVLLHRIHSPADVQPVEGGPLASTTAPSTTGACGQRVIMLDGSNLGRAYLPAVDFSFPIPFARHRIGRTVTHVAAHPATGTLVLGTVIEVPFLLFDPEDGAAVQDPSKDPTRQTCYRGIVELVSAGGRWSTDGFPLKQNETICSLELVSLSSVSTAGKRRDYIAVGTMVSHGEDRPAKGGIYIFDIVQTVPDYSAAATARGIAGKPGYKLKLIDREQSLRGPVTALCDLNGYLIHSVGQKVCATPPLDL